MQVLRSLFARTPATQQADEQKANAVLPVAPVELDAQQLAAVSGGLPRVGGFRTAVVAESALPSAD